MADDEEKQKIDDQPEEDFDFSLKKKKKKPKKQVELDDEAEENKEAPELDEADEAGEKAEEEDLDNLFDLKKKKKKKSKAVSLDEDGGADKENDGLDGEEGGPASGAGAAELDEDFDLSELKKKPKKKRNMAEFMAELGDEEDNAVAVSGLGDEDDIFAPDDAGENNTTAPEDEAWLKSDRDYTYQELLGRVFKILRANNPELAGEKKKYTIVPPSVYRDSNKKTVFANIGDICKRMHRQPEHVIQFLFAELGTSGSIDGAQRLIIKGRFQAKQIENVLRRYIVDYVTCKTCRSPDTILTKDNRLYFVQCESCGSTRSVSAIKTGFKAVGQGERKAKARAAAS